MRYNFAGMVILLSFWTGLQAEQVQLVPNPFSPFVLATAEGNTSPGLAVKIQADTDSSALRYVRVVIYGTDGLRVRTLLAGASVPEEGMTLYWDGLDDHQSLVRNGRYVVVVQWSSDASGKVRKATQYPVVVFK